MKRWIVLISLLAGVAVLLGVGHAYLQRRATREMNTKMRQVLTPVISNPENLTLTNAPIRLAPGLARIPVIEIDGKDLAVQDSVRVKSAHVTLRDVRVKTSGTSARISHVGDSAYEVTFTAEDLTQFLRRQQPGDIGGLILDPSTVTVTLSPPNIFGVAGEGTLRQYRARVPFSLQGTLSPDAATGDMHFQPTEIIMGGRSVLEMMQGPFPAPLQELLPANLRGKITGIIMKHGTVTFTGQLDGARFLSAK